MANATETTTVRAATAPIGPSETLQRAVAAAAVFGQLDQEATDRIVRAVFVAALDNRVRLARLAAEETGLGRWEDKATKNLVASLLVHEGMRGEKTVGIISDDPTTGVAEVAQPLGPILAIIPVTNPTSTTIFKILIALKTRNPLIISAHHKAQASCRETVAICYEAALAADAPEDCIQFFERASREETQALMSDRRLALILATGGESVVKAAYSSGTPALGVGPGNVPVFIESSADVPFAVEQILASKLFDNGTVCASEQAIVVERSVADRVRAELLRRGARFLEPEEVRAVGRVAYDTTKRCMQVDVIGQPVEKIAALAGIRVEAGTSLLVAPLGGVGVEYPLSSEVLAPIVAWYEAESVDAAVKVCLDLNFHGGVGHTVSIFSNDAGVVERFALLMNAGRILVNTPASQGAVGGMFNSLATSFTLGCGSGGRNITTDNVTTRHLLNIQRICRRRMNERFQRLDLRRCLDETVSAEEIEREYNRNY